MGTETELKLSVNPETIQSLLQHPLLATAPVRQHLYNTYFDTSDLALTHQQVAVRERRINDQTLLTVKTAGKSQDGVSTRCEWEGPTQPGAFDFLGLVEDTLLAKTLTTIADELVPVFVTDFERRSWRIAMPNGEVEVALDRGTILVNRHGREASVPICELELELKAGKVDVLKTLAQQLQSTTQLTPANESKAARGYQLFHSLAA